MMTTIVWQHVVRDSLHSCAALCARARGGARCTKFCALSNSKIDANFVCKLLLLKCKGYYLSVRCTHQHAIALGRLLLLLLIF